MLRRATSAAAREGRAISPSATVGRDSGVKQSPDRDRISTAGLNQVNRVAEQVQDLQLDQPENQVYGLRVSADQVPVDLARLASGDVELFEGPEQDLTGAFPEGAETVRNPEPATGADMGLPHAQVNVRDLAQQIAQSGPITAEAGTLLQLLLDQHEALQESVVRLEKSRSGSVISAHIAIEGTGDVGIAAHSSRPGGSTLAQSVVRPHALTGGQHEGLGEIGAASTISSTAGVLFGGSSQLVAASKPQFGTSSP